MFLQQRIIVSLSSQSFLFLAGLEVKVVPLKKSYFYISCRLEYHYLINYLID